jgi:hypothetical protein
MPLDRLLQNTAFDPKLIEAMVFAFETICQERGLKPIRHDAERERIAKTVVQYAQRGITDPEKLRQAVLDDT